MICFGILRIFGEKSQKLEIWAYRVRRSIGSPRRGVDLRQGMGCLAAVRLGCQNGTPRIRKGIATLCCDEGLCRSVAVLRHNVATVHNKKILDCCSESL